MCGEIREANRFLDGTLERRNHLRGAQLVGDIKTDVREMGSEAADRGWLF
jgi:hypothetical protein